MLKSSSNSKKLSRSELFEALKEPVSKDLEEMIHVYSESFLEDPMMVWVTGLNDNDNKSSSSSSSSSIAKMDPARKKELQFKLNASLTGWSNRNLLVRKKGVVLGIKSAVDGSLAGVMSVSSGNFQHTGLVDMISNAIHVGAPPIYGKDKIHYAPYANKRLDALLILEKKRKELMKNNEKYIYLQTVGVLKDHQGKGYGGKLLRTILHVADTMGVALYLETESEENESLYHHFGFDTAEALLVEAKTGTTPTAPTLKMWLMIRQPSPPPLKQ